MGKSVSRAFRGAILLGLSLIAVEAAGGAYRSEMLPADWRSLQSFYRLYVTGPAARLEQIGDELTRLQRNAEALRRPGAQARCKPDCEALAAAGRYLADAEAAVREARRIVKGNLKILLRNQGVATRANAAYMDAQAKYELRKLGFDMSMIVAKTFELDFGPLLAQLGRNLGMEEDAATLSEKGLSFVSDTAKRYTGEYGTKKSLMKGNLKRSAVSAVAKKLADEMAGRLGVDTTSERHAAFFASFTTTFADKVWNALNEAAASGKVVTRANLAAMALESGLKAYADEYGKELASDVAHARSDSARSESMRLLTIAEYKAMAALDRKLFHSSRSFPAKGVAVDLNRERGRFVSMRNKVCGSDGKPPGVVSVKAGDQREVISPEPSLARVVHALRQANALLGRQVECAAVVVAGRVLNEEGEPLGGARVEVSIGGRRFRATSDSSGAYRIEIPGSLDVPGTVLVKAEMDGYEPRSRAVARTRLGHADLTLRETDSGSAGGCTFAGEWESDWGRMRFEQNGTTVAGVYEHDSGRIRAEMEGRVLRGVWAEAPTYNVDSWDGGDVEFRLSEDCASFSGRWRYGRAQGKQAAWHGTWSGHRIRRRRGRGSDGDGRSPAAQQPEDAATAAKRQAEGKPVMPASETPLEEAWRVYALEVHRSPYRNLPGIDVIETRLLVGGERAVLERVRYPVSAAKGPAVDAVLWGVNWRSGRRLERKQAEGEEAVRALKARAEKLRGEGFPLESLPARMADAYGGEARPLKDAWMPQAQRSTGEAR